MAVVDKVDVTDVAALPAVGIRAFVVNVVMLADVVALVVVDVVVWVDVAMVDMTASSVTVKLEILYGVKLSVFTVESMLEPSNFTQVCDGYQYNSINITH